MTPSELKYNVEQAGHEPYFFTRYTMANYGCYSDEDVWVLWRKRPVKHGLQNNAYFDKKTFRRVRR